jgi:hypothetical protein
VLPHGFAAALEGRDAKEKAALERRDAKEKERGRL